MSFSNLVPRAAETETTGVAHTRRIMPHRTIVDPEYTLRDTSRYVAKCNGMVGSSDGDRA